MAHRNARRALSGLAALSAAGLAAFMLLTQALAVLPVDWLTWMMHVRLLQAAVLRLGSLRDGLGVWNVFVALLSAGLAAFVLRVAGPRRVGKILLTASLLGLCAAIATSAMLLSAVTQLGVAALPPLPTLPFAAVGGQPDKTVTFGKPQGTELRADLYLPARGQANLHAVLVSIHGGGFSYGSRAPNAYTRFLADHGYAVMDIDYRLASKDVHTWKTETADVGCALVWIGTHARDYGIDPHRVATFGESSGGNLAINAAYMANAGTLEPSCGSAADLPSVRAAIGGYPAVDLTHGTRASAIGRLVGRYYLGGAAEQFPDLYAEVDSATHINPKSPPTLIFQGSRDHLVLATQARDFAALLSARGVVNSYIEYPGLDHGCGDSGSVLTYATSASRLLILRWLDMYLN